MHILKQAEQWPERAIPRDYERSRGDIPWESDEQRADFYRDWEFENSPLWDQDEDD